MSGTTYTGVAGNFNPATSFQITEPVDADPQAAATYNVHDAESLSDAIEWLRQLLRIGFGGSNLVTTTTAASVSLRYLKLWDITVDTYHVRIYSADAASVAA